PSNTPCHCLTCSAPLPRSAPHPSLITTYPTTRFSPPSSSLITTTARSTPSCPLITCSTSPNSIRWPLTFTCSSLLPTTSRLPSSRYLPISPLRYNLPPSLPNGSGTNFSAV